MLLNSSFHVKNLFLYVRGFAMQIIGRLLGGACFAVLWEAWIAKWTKIFTCSMFLYLALYMHSLFHFLLMCIYELYLGQLFVKLLVSASSPFVPHFHVPSFMSFLINSVHILHIFLLSIIEPVIFVNMTLVAVSVFVFSF